MPHQGDIVLIPVPFTDLSSQKRRPVIVISNDLVEWFGLQLPTYFAYTALAVAMSSVPEMIARASGKIVSS